MQLPCFHMGIHEGHITAAPVSLLDKLLQTRPVPGAASAVTPESDVCIPGPSGHAGGPVVFGIPAIRESHDQGRLGQLPGFHRRPLAGRIIAKQPRRSGGGGAILGAAVNQVAAPNVADITAAIKHQGRANEGLEGNLGIGRRPLLTKPIITQIQAEIRRQHGFK